jgi:hypothetical protein
VCVERISRLALAALLVPALLILPVTGAPPVHAASPSVQAMPDPPAPGDVLFQSALTDAEVFEPGACPTGKAFGGNVGEGFKLTVRGKCVSEATAANLPVPGRNITIWDGDVALDFKLDAGAERAGINLYSRIQGGQYMAAYVSLATGRAELFRRENGANTVVASRDDLGTLDPANWNRLALRLRGGEVWLLLNDEAMLYTNDVLDQTGGIGIALVREGNVDDTDEVAVVFRDLTVTTLVAPPGDGEPASEEPEAEPAPAP